MNRYLAIGLLMVLAACASARPTPVNPTVRLAELHQRCEDEHPGSPAGHSGCFAQARLALGKNGKG